MPVGDTTHGYGPFAHGSNTQGVPVLVKLGEVRREHAADEDGPDGRVAKPVDRRRDDDDGWSCQVR